MDQCPLRLVDGGNTVTRPRGLLRLWIISTIFCIVAATTYLNSEARRIQHAFVQSAATPSHIFYTLDERMPGTQAYERRVFWTVRVPIALVLANRGARSHLFDLVVDRMGLPII